MAKSSFLFFLIFLYNYVLSQVNLPNIKNYDINQIQQISVTISGDFPVNGTFPANVSERLDEFITRIIENEKAITNNYNYNYNYNTNLINNASQEKKLKYALRNIRLIRENSTTIIDLHKYRMTGNLSYNPFLKNNDVIIFPKNDIEHNYISIEGAINNPGKFLYVKGDKLKDAIELALGFSEAFDKIDNIYIYRSNLPNPIILQNNELNFVLKPADRIIVQADFNSKKDRRVLVIGEVNNPGYIPIVYSNNNLKYVIQSAGGFRKNVDSTNIELIKKSSLFYSYQTQTDLNFTQLYLNEYRIQEMKKNIEFLELQRMAYLYPEDTTSFTKDLLLKKEKNSFIFNTSEITGDTIINTIEDGDVIIVNSKPDYVYLFGQTGFVGNIKFSPFKTASYYLYLADGIGDYARKDEIYLIRYKTKKWINIKDKLNSEILEPGDYIWIPKEPRREFNYYTQRISSIAQIISALATTIIAVVAIFKK